MKQKEWNIAVYSMGFQPPIPYKECKTYAIFEEGRGDVAYIQHIYDEDVIIENTNLIRFAPDLLVALQNAVDALEWAADVIKDIQSGSDYAHVLRQARVAISRATGKTVWTT